MQYSAPSTPDVATSTSAAWEIFDPSTFLSMSSLDKRNVLRASGVSELPRPRQGVRALDNLLEDLMDDAVRSEYFRLKAGKKSRQIPSINPPEGRQAVLQAMTEALESGDINTAEKLRERFTMLTLLKADHTQPQGSYQQYLDQDEWYMIARKKAMGISRSKSDNS
jgi:hypothetical protein